MSIFNFIPELWNVGILEIMEIAHVYGKICRCEIDAPITKQGQTVHINGIGEIDIGTYTGADITMQTLSDAGVTMVIDQADYFDFWVSDVDALQANANLMAAATRRAAYRMKNASDKVIYDAMVAAAGLTGPTEGTLDVTAAISNIAEMDLLLKEAEVPKEERWITMPHWMGTKLLLAGIYHADDLKGNINGFITRVLGPDVYESAQNAATVVLAGSYGAAAYAEQIVETSAFKPEKRFGDALKGLHVYGTKIVIANEIALGGFTESVETVI
jgi:hypothetical protein